MTINKQHIKLADPALSYRNRRGGCVMAYLDQFGCYVNEFDDEASQRFSLRCIFHQAAGADLKLGLGAAL